MVVKAPDGQECRFYLNPDKNPATIRKEVFARKLKEIIEPSLGGKQAFIRKSTGSVMVDRRVLASIIIVDQDTTRIAWFHALRSKYGIEEDATREQFELATGTGDSCRKPQGSRSRTPVASLCRLAW